MTYSMKSVFDWLVTVTGEFRTIALARLVPHFSDEILVLERVSGLDGSPHVLVSLRKYPEADRVHVCRSFSGLTMLGSCRDRRDALELPVVEALRNLMSPFGFKVVPRPEHWHLESSDVVLLGPRNFNIELRNRRSHVHVRLGRKDAEIIHRLNDIGVQTVMVVGRCTPKYRAKVEALGAVLIETGLYAVKDEAQKAMLAGYGFMVRDVLLGSEVGSRIAEMIGAEILDGDEVAVPVTVAQSAKPMSERASKSRVTEIMKRQTARHRVAEATQLYEAGVPTQIEAANLMGMSTRWLREMFKQAGESPPWKHGGDHSGGGVRASGSETVHLPVSREDQKSISKPTGAGEQKTAAVHGDHPDRESDDHEIDTMFDAFFENEALRAPRISEGCVVVSRYRRMSGECRMRQPQRSGGSLSLLGSAASRT
jgi:hypothetical protein